MSASSSSSPVPALECVLPAQTDQQWFRNEVHPHEGALRSYVRGAFPGVLDVDDVVQESFLRMWRARTRHQFQTARGFLFRIAKHVAVDVLRRQRRSPAEAVSNLDMLSVPAELDVAQAVSADEKIRLLAAAVAALPTRRQQIFVRVRIDGVSRKDAADELAISIRTVDEQLERAYVQIERFLRDRGLDGFDGP